MPVSTLIWTFRVRPDAAAAAENARAVSKSPTAWVMSYSSSTPAYSTGVTPRMRMGSLIPALRSSTASSRQATAR